MRNELENIEIIEKYLKNELSAEEKKVFEEQLKTDAKLQKEVEVQRDVIKGIERIGAKQSIQKSYKKYKWGKSGFNLGLGATIVIAVTSVFLWYNSNYSSSTVVDNVLPELNEVGTKEWADADKLIPSQKFAINTTSDTVIETQGGIVMYIPQGSFLDENGNIITGEVEFEVKEALDANQIIQGGLSSMSGNRLLESAGMFYVNARKDGKTVQINPENGIYTEVPTDEVKPDMQLFEGKRMADGSIDWINPAPLEKFLTPVDIHSLNFYPPKYEPKLAELGYDLSDREFKDSLYYSFAWENESKNNCYRITDIHNGDAIINTYRNNGNLFKAIDHINWTSHANNLKCNEFDFSFEINISDSIRLSDLRFLKSSDNDKYEFIDKLQLNKSNNSFLFTQKIKIKSGTFVLNFGLKTHYLDKESNRHENLSFVITTKQLQNNNCSGPIVKYSNKVDFTSENDTGATSSLLFGRKLPYQFAQEEVDSVAETYDSYQVCGINPAKIKTIWSEDFNNTMISTREFEERLPAIFGTCNDKVLDLYINNLNIDMYKIDSMAAEICGGNSRDNFIQFATRKDGKVKIDDKRVEKLKKHYEEKQKLIAEAIAKTREKFEKENKRLNEDAGKTRAKHSQDELKRTEDNYVEEFNLNLKEAYRQLGKPKPDRLDAKGIYKLRLKTGGWKNVDAYVMESLDNRETLDYTDPTTGKRQL